MATVGQFTKTHIANLALSHLGAGRIVSFDDDPSPESEMVDSFYDTVVRAELENFDWSFARKRAVLSNVSYTLREPWTKSLGLPDDCLHVRAVYDSGDPEPDNILEREPYLIVASGSRLILLTSFPDTVAIRYTFYNDVPSCYPANFVMALAARIAGHVSFALTKKSDLRDAQFVQADNYRALAQQADMLTSEAPQPIYSQPTSAGQQAPQQRQPQQ